MPSLRLVLPLLALPAFACAPAADSADSGGSSDTAGDSGGDSNTVKITTSKGEITVELDPTNAPVTTANFLTYVDEGFFDGDDGDGATTFHRVIPGFMIQGGGYTASGQTKTTHDAIVLESDNGLSNLRGTIAMARTSVPDSATSQFFINVADNTTLDYRNANNPGYAVFGTVTAGMDVADAIVAVDRDANDKPNEAIEITDCERQ